MLRWRAGAVRIDRYWKLDYAQKLAVADDAEAAELVRAALRTAVGRRMIADVPLGAFLSGGIDSTAVVAAMAEQSNSPVKTFSIGFESEAFDELPYARQVAERFSTDHHELVVRPDAVELLPKLVRHYGEPFADHSAIPSFYLAEMARRHVTVALNGDGGDEAFGGYGRYVNTALLRHLDVLPPTLRRAMAVAGRRIPSNGNLTSTRNRLRRASAQLPLTSQERYMLAMSRTRLGLREVMYTGDFRRSLEDSPAEVIATPWEETTASNLIDTMLDVDQRTYLPGDLLVKMDIATMAHGLEARSPLLDHELLELAAALPPSRKVRGREKKIALRGALRGLVPDSLIDRPKQGFQVPMAEWLRGDLREMAREALLGEGARARGYLRHDVVKDLLERHLAREEDNSAILWSFLVFELWHEQVVDARPAGAPAMSAV
jgi:asparagine synthase (glutamine-hydrolysing)